MSDKIETAELERIALVLDRGFGNPTFAERHAAAAGLRELVALRRAPAVPDDAVKLWQDTADNDGFCQLLGLIPLRDTSTGEAIMWREKDGDFIDFAVALRDTIEAQAAELARLTYLQGRDQASRQHHMKLRREAEVEVARLRDENARLRAALQRIADGRGVCGMCGTWAVGEGSGVTTCDCSNPHWTFPEPDKEPT